MISLYDLRRKQLIAYMEQKKIDTALITSPVNVYYFTGFSCNPHERFLALAVDRSGCDWLFVPSLDLDAARLHSSVQHLVPISDIDDPMVVLEQNIGNNVAWFGVEKNDIQMVRFEQLQGTFPKAGFISLEDLIMSLRLKKSENEAAKVRLAVDVVQKAIEYATQKAVIGMTELELVAELEYQMKCLGGEKLAFDSIVLAGTNSALPHGKPGSTPFRQNDFILIDIGVHVEGFCSDISRTFIMGEGTKAQEHIYETVLAANLQAIGAINVGTPFGALDRAARSAISSQGYGPYFTHRVGHGFGLEGHEPPSIHGQNEMIIEPGMLFTIEPGVYVPSIGGVRIEDDIFIKEDGSVEVLTNYPKALRRL